MKNELLNTFLETIQSAGKAKTSAYDTSATVKRIENDVAWVHIPGGVDETPVKLTVAAAVGDNVQVRVSGGTAFLVGNATAPPTDDSLAKKVEMKVKNVTKTVERNVKDIKKNAKATSDAQKAADEADEIAQATKQHFWDDDSGIHVSSDEDNPEGANNILMNSLGILLRTGNKILSQFSASQVAFYDGVGNAASNIIALFGANGAQIGKSSGTRMNVANNGFTLTHKHNGQDFVIGRMYCNPEDGSIYFTFGDRIGSAGDGSFVNGTANTASGAGAHAEGSNTTASNTYSHSEGMETTASGAYAHAEGNATLAGGTASHAEGSGTRAWGFACHTEGQGTRTSATASAQTVVGQYNENLDAALFLVGCGSSDAARDNAFYVGQSGNTVVRKNALFHGKICGDATTKPLFVKDTKAKASVSIAASDTVDSSFSVAKSGYTPIALLGYQINGTNGSRCFASRAYLDGNNFYYFIRNTHSAAASVTITAYVAYIASTAL
jgi:hypothetical protein